MVRAVVLIFALIVALAGASAPAVRAQELPRSDGWVVIPIEDYRALRLKAYPPEPPPEPPPMPFAVSRVDYDLRAATDAFVGEVRITVDILSDKWTLVPIPWFFSS